MLICYKINSRRSNCFVYNIQCPKNLFSWGKPFYILEKVSYLTIVLTSDIFNMKYTISWRKDMIKDKKVVIFDLDGTLIDSIGIWNEIDKQLIKTVGSIEIDSVDIGKQRDDKLKEYSKCEDVYLEYCGFLKEKYHSDMSKEEIKKIRYEIASDYLRNIVDYKPAAENVLKYLKNKGFTLVIASTTNDHTVEVYKNDNQNIISKANFNEIFTIIYSKGAVKELKPNPEVHYKILKELNVKAEECLIVEDSLMGVEAANNAGIEVAVIYDKYSDGNREKINELSQYQFYDFNQMLNCIKDEMEGN